MMNKQKLFCTIVTISTFAVSLPAMEFDFRPLASLCRVEVNLSTAFGSGSIRGTFGQMVGTLNFHPEFPEKTSGKIVLSSRSLRFNYPKVAYEAHAPEWLNSSQYPQISFELESLKNISWQEKELRSEASGILKIKGIVKPIQIPLSTHYFRKERRKYEGKNGDLLRLEGLVKIPRSEFGLSSGKLTNAVEEEITIHILLTGASDRVRPFLPSRLFLR
jgi:polyisoprenoid-binding protein YceI